MTKSEFDAVVSVAISTAMNKQRWQMFVVMLGREHPSYADSYGHSPQQILNDLKRVNNEWLLVQVAPERTSIIPLSAIDYIYVQGR